MEIEKTITLRKPVTNSGRTYETIDLREPTAGELEQAAKATTNLGVVITLIAIVAKIPRTAAEALCQRDLKEAGDFLDSFSMDDPATGETSSPT